MTTTHAGTTPGATHDALVERLDPHVREVVRREGVDPQADDAGVVRRIAESGVRDHDERSLNRGMGFLADMFRGAVERRACEFR